MALHYGLAILPLNFLKIIYIYIYIYTPFFLIHYSVTQRNSLEYAELKVCQGRYKKNVTEGIHIQKYVRSIVDGRVKMEDE